MGCTFVHVEYYVHVCMYLCVLQICMYSVCMYVEYVYFVVNMILLSEVYLKPSWKTTAASA